MNDLRSQLLEFKQLLKTKEEEIISITSDDNYKKYIQLADFKGDVKREYRELKNQLETSKKALVK